MIITIEKRFHAALASRDNCNNCTRAKAHARKHGKDEAYISCRAHRVVDACKSRFVNVEFVNPSNTAGFEVVPAPEASTGHDIDGWAIIARSASTLHVKEDMAILVTVAEVDGGEYIARHPAVIIVIAGVEHLLHDAESVYAVAMAMVMAGGRTINTCVWGKAEPTNIEHVTPIQRDSCPECPPAPTVEEIERCCVCNAPISEGGVYTDANTKKTYCEPCFRTTPGTIEIRLADIEHIINISTPSDVHTSEFIDNVSQFLPRAEIIEIINDHRDHIAHNIIITMLKKITED
jgi:hypothetical protein